MIGRVKSFFLRGTRNFFRHRVMNTASICIIAASLIFMGVFAAIAMNVNELMSKVGDSRMINVYLKPDAGGRAILDIEGDLKKIDGIKEVRYFSKEDRMAKVASEVYGEEGAVFSSGANPLRNSYILTAEESADLAQIDKELAGIDGVDEVIRLGDLIAGIDYIIGIINNVLLWLMAIFMLISVFIIYNTIKMDVAVCREEIRIMKIIGATNGFIISPFIFRGALLSLLGALLSTVIIGCGYGFAMSKIVGFIPPNMIEFVPVGKVIGVISPLLLGAGTIIGIAGSGIAVLKEFKNEGD